MNARALISVTFSIVFLPFAVGGCTTARALAEEPSSWESSLERGDRVVIHDVDGQTHNIRFHAIADGKLYGERTGRTPSEYAGEIGDIQSLEIHEISAGKTVTNVVVGALTVVGWIVWAGLQSGAAGM